MHQGQLLRHCFRAGAVLGSLGACLMQAQATPRPVGTYALGPITLELTDTGFRATVGGQLGAAGRVQWIGDTAVVHDTEGPRACDSAVEGRYVASLRGDTLRLTGVTDPCQGRRGVFAGGPFVRAATLRVVSGVTLIDGTGAPPREEMSVELREGRIVDVYRTGSRAVPAGAAVVDLRGQWLIPGLIDAHVHVATDPSEADARATVLAQLRAALLGGVTTVRDMAGDARTLADLSRGTRTGDLVGPDIVFSAVWAGPRFMRDPRVQASTRGATAGGEPWMRTVETSTDWAVAGAEARGSGARGVKLYADASADVVRAAAAAAHRAGLRVWAHATLFPARPSDLVGAGVDVLSHAPLLAWQTTDPLPDYRARRNAPYASVDPEGPAITALLERMRAQGTLLEPTLFVFSRDARDTEIRSWATRLTKRANAVGVGIVAGTDGLIAPGSSEGPNLHRELELLVEAGLTPLQAIQAATGSAARALGIEAETGVIRPGLAADLVVLSADPVADIRNTRRIERVIKRGRDVVR